MTHQLRASNSDPQCVLQAVLRTDLYAFHQRCFNTLVPSQTFVPNWYLRAIAYQLERVRRGEIKRLLIILPPRAGKSLMASVAFPAFALGHDPARRIVCVSHSEDLAAKHARDHRLIMQTRWYRDLFPGTVLSRRKATELDFETTNMGGRLSTSVGGSLTGRGGSLVIADDPQKAADAYSEAKRKTTIDWFGNTLLTRLDDKQNDAIIVVMQRLHENDLAGHLLRAGGWTFLCLPAIATADETIPIGNGRVHHRKAGDVLDPVREPIEVLDQIKAEMGSFDFEAQYQQNPLPPQGNILKAEWLQTYDVLPDTGQVVQSWDLAVKDGEDNDFCVCVTARIVGNAIYLLNVQRQKLDYPAQRRAIRNQARQHAADVILIEASATGSPLMADLRHLGGTGIPTPIGVRPQGSKLERLRLQTARVEAGDLHLPRHAPWLDAFKTELLGFPNGRHDDQVDAPSQMLAWHERQRRHQPKAHVRPIMISF